MSRRKSQTRLQPGRAAAKAWDRLADLPRLLPLWPEQIEDHTIAGRERLIERLASALRAERARGIAGHWAYDLARHARLQRALRHERAELEALKGRRGLPAPAQSRASRRPH